MCLAEQEAGGDSGVFIRVKVYVCYRTGSGGDSGVFIRVKVYVCYRTGSGGD